jgi:hypothetical protein
MRFYFTGKDYCFPGDSGVVRESSGPFKGICQQCKNRTVVRLYPYSCEEWLGVLCKECYREIAEALSDAGVYHDEEDE